MTLAAPVIVVFTRHAERRAIERRLDLRDVSDLLLASHALRQRNSGRADWLIRAHGIAIAYDWPDEVDATTALVISVWRE